MKRSLDSDEDTPKLLLAVVIIAVVVVLAGLISLRIEQSAHAGAPVLELADR